MSVNPPRSPLPPITSTELQQKSQDVSRGLASLGNPVTESRTDARREAKGDAPSHPQSSVSSRTDDILIRSETHNRDAHLRIVEGSDSRSGVGSGTLAELARRHGKHYGSVNESTAPLSSTLSSIAKALSSLGARR